MFRVAKSRVVARAPAGFDLLFLVSGLETHAAISHNRCQQQSVQDAFRRPRISRGLVSSINTWTVRTAVSHNEHGVSAHVSGSVTFKSQDNKVP